MGGVSGGVRQPCAAEAQRRAARACVVRARQRPFAADSVGGSDVRGGRAEPVNAFAGRAGGTACAVLVIVLGELVGDESAQGECAELGGGVR